MTRRDVADGQRFRYHHVDDDGELVPNSEILIADGTGDLWPDGQRRSAVVPLAYAYRVEIVQGEPC